MNHIGQNMKRLWEFRRIQPINTAKATRTSKGRPASLEDDTQANLSFAIVQRIARAHDIPVDVLRTGTLPTKEVPTTRFDTPLAAKGALSLCAAFAEGVLSEESSAMRISRGFCR